MKRQPTMENARVAEILRSIAERLREQQANPFRVNAYRHAADTVEQLDGDVRHILKDHGREGLELLPGIGKRLAVTIEEIVHTGRSAMLDRVNGQTNPIQLFRRVPGIGPKLAQQIHESLHVESLQALELAAHDGRLATVPGIGARRLAAIQMGLAGLLGRHYHPASALQTRPSINDLLHIDELYRTKAQAGELPTIAPRRFNPKHLAWLPVWHTQYNGWDYTVLFSNTARAHELKRTYDWIVIYFDNESHQEGQCTLVTEYHGSLAGQRVVRGRERECAEHYHGASAADSESQTTT
ncbi:MAG: helix-hairpin-helix domain-containing protein [Pseudomonadales bacterium]